MKKKNLKSLSLKKASVSKLNGGEPVPIQLTVNLQECAFTIVNTECTTTWISELYSACCPPTQGLECESFNFPCNESFQFPCEQSVNIVCQP
jgi:hypothetical protein